MDYSGQPFDTPEEALAHFGVKGMRWGVRKKDKPAGDSGGSEGPTRAQRGRVRYNEAVIANVQKERIKNTLNSSEKAGRALKESEAYNKTLDKTVSSLNAQNERIRSGKLTKGDKLAVGTTAAFYSQYLIDSKPSIAHMKTQAEYEAILPPKLTKAQMKKNMEDSQAKYLAKIDPSRLKADGTPKGLSDRQKKALLYTGLAALAVGGVVALNMYGNKAIMDEAKKMSDFPNAQEYLAGVSKSKMSWYSGYVKQQSWDRPAFELPAGHTFHRLSTAVEEGFNPGTYATANMDDFRRYATGFRQEIGDTGLQHITFKSTAPLKVPDLTTTVETLREAMQEVNGSDKVTITKEQALNAYKNYSGGSWRANDDKVIGAFFNNLSKKGFGAIVDEMDAGVLGETPLVILENFTKENMTKKVAQAMTKEDLLEAERLVQKLANPK